MVGWVLIGENFAGAPDTDFLRSAFRDYRDFALQSSFAAALPLSSTLAVQVMLGVQLGTDAIGYYVLVQSIITMPVTVIVLSSAPVVFHRLVLAADETPDRLPGLALKAMLGYLAMGAVCMSPIVFFGPIIFAFAFAFAFAFGDEWH